MGNAEDESVLSVAALGRPFSLGMLYDSRTEKMIPGITLWDQATLEKRKVQNLETSDFHVLCSDSLDDKASALDIHASLKLSFLGGLVDVEGAAKYLDNRTSSKHQERVTLQYKCTTKSESLTMEQLGQGKIEHPEVFEHGTATHVVTSIVYGAQAFFIFDRQLSSADQDKKVEGKLKAMINKIPGLRMGGKGKVDLSEDEKKKTEEFSCRFFGDFLLRQNPSSFVEAVKLYQELPKLLGTGGENAVPMKVQLYPLFLIDRKATRLVKEISISLIRETEIFFEDAHDLNIKCKDILKSDAVKKFLVIQLQMQEFINLTETYKRVIQKELSLLLPRIRGGGYEERCLAELLNRISQSPVSIFALRSWLQFKSTQIKILNEYIRAMGNIQYATEPGDLECVVMSPENTYSLCLTISMPSNDSQLEKMKNYCLEKQFVDNGKKSSHAVTAQPINSTSMMEVTGGFRDFYNANDSNKRIAFIVAQEFSESDAFDARVRCYKYGRLMNNDYKLPSSPEEVEALAKNTTHKSVTINWNPPKHGASTITSYAVSCCKNGTEEVCSRVSLDHNKNQVTIPGLAANTEYEVRVWGRCEVGDGPVEDAKLVVKTRPVSQPEMLYGLKESSTKVFLKWQSPTCVADGCTVKQYIIKQQTKPGHWEESLRIAASELSCIVELFPNSIPSFRVAASCGSDGVSCDSEPCTIDLTKQTTSENTKQNICALSVKVQNRPPIFSPQLKLVSSNSEDMIDRFEFGTRKVNIQDKVIMLVGATGSGKSTLINGFVNYIFGVDWTDPFRFKMILEPNVGNQAMSQTTKITSYTLHHQEGFRIPYTLTVIDTPGFGDVSGIMRDKEITKCIHKFFTAHSGNGITHIDGVAFVANSSQPRLTPTQKYIFDQILSLFGKDIADNIFLLLTFADGKKPQVLSGIKEAKIPYKKSFKFNNSALYALPRGKSTSQESDSDEGDGSFDTMFWEMGAKSFTLFLDQLKHVESKSLVLTQDVLNERNRLQTYIAGIQKDIRQGLTTLERLGKEREMLENHHADIERNKNFEYEVKEEVYVSVPIPNGQYVTNCLNCNRTCHEFCKISDDNLKRGCWAMTNGVCRICPNKCDWSMHKNFPHKYELEIKKTKKTVSELLQRYEEATQKKLTTENLIEEVNEEFHALQVKILGMTHTVRKSLERLQEIALRPNPLTTVQYLDVLIETERSQAEPGWQARLQQLTTLRKEAEYMEMIADKGFDPFQQYTEKLELKMRRTKTKVWTRVFDYFKK